MMKKLSVFAFFILLTACTDNGILLRSNGKNYSSEKTNGVYKIGMPYQINGRWYYPSEDLNYKEIGIASWYGPDFHNGITANGEKYDMYAMTAAHRTLPLPSIVKVTNLENGRSVIVRVNDRGPFVNNRIIDVSKSAAEALGFQTLGTTQVRVEYLKEESLALKKRILDNGGKIVGGSSENTPLPQNIQKVPEIKEITQPEEGYFIQVGSFSDKENAWRVSNDLSSVTPVRLGEIQVRDTIFYRVRLGPFSEAQEDVSVLDRVRKKYPSARIIQEVKK